MNKTNSKQLEDYGQDAITFEAAQANDPFVSELTRFYNIHKESLQNPPENVECVKCKDSGVKVFAINDQIAFVLCSCEARLTVLH